MKSSINIVRVIINIYQYISPFASIPYLNHNDHIFPRFESHWMKESRNHPDANFFFCSRQLSTMHLSKVLSVAILSSLVPAITGIFHLGKKKVYYVESNIVKKYEKNNLVARETYDDWLRRQMQSDASFASQMENDPNYWSQVPMYYADMGMPNYNANYMPMYYGGVAAQNSMYNLNYGATSYQDCGYGMLPACR